MRHSLEIVLKIAHAKICVEMHQLRRREEQTPITRYFNSTLGRYVFARMMLLSAYDSNHNRYTINSIADTLNMSRQATSSMIKECLDAEYIVKCSHTGYHASDELLEAFDAFMPLYERVVKECSLHEVLIALETSRKIAR